MTWPPLVVPGAIFVVRIGLATRKAWKARAAAAIARRDVQAPVSAMPARPPLGDYREGEQ